MHTPLPWWFRQYLTDDDPEMLAKLGLKPVPALDNEGSRTIMMGNLDEGTAKPIARVLLQADVKRGQRHNAEDPERDANAEFIVRAVNSHADLVAQRDLLQAIVDCYGLGNSPEVFCRQVHDFIMEARAALERAKASG